MSLNAFSIQNAAASKLQDLSRTSLSGEGFSSNEVSAIAAAIAAAIEEYDQQRTNES